MGLVGSLVAWMWIRITRGMACNEAPSDAGQDPVGEIWGHLAWTHHCIGHGSTAVGRGAALPFLASSVSLAGPSSCLPPCALPVGTRLGRALSGSVCL